MGGIFRKEGKKMLKKGKILEILGKNCWKCMKVGNIFSKGSLLQAIIIVVVGVTNEEAHCFLWD